MSGGTPAYGRRQTTWGTPSNGEMVGSKVSIPVPGTTIVNAGLFTAQTGGTYLDKFAIPTTTVSANADIDVTPKVTLT
ncbi:hypothetical protein SEA_HIBISCUS_29 [Gordonia phage Hibiscus]